ncbi:MAG TPA: class I SAM-dependent methyltransferase [Thermoanaerobaculaceae bacterium]|nr:class I SAM-dependent methyltransferase [Thermoanaerobaculaceae bacterium]
MPGRTVSRTALGTAYVRAAHQLLDASPHILEDPLAVTILGPAGVQRIYDSAESYQTAQRRALRAHIVLRSRFAEDRLAASLLRGVTQYVILGAGFDTFALRMPSWAHSLQVVEVDHAATQEVKRSRIVATGLAVPKNVHFAAIDFEQESLCDSLRRNAVAMDTPTFFSWLGVTMYLTQEAIDATLRCLGSFPLGSEVVLTFAPPSTGAPSPFSQAADGVGESWISHFEPEALKERLQSARFSLVEFLLPAEANARYFRQRPQDLPPPTRTNIVTAVRAP